jgi:N-acetyltransferase
MQVIPVTLEGEFVRLVPLSLEHLPQLCAIGLEPALWAATTIRVQTPEQMEAYVRAALEAQAAGTAVPFAILLKETGQVVGTTRYHSIVPAHRRLEIGFTWVGLPWQRTAVNTEAKVLLLRHAFEQCGAQRVEFKADVENERSCRSLLRLGATREGTLSRYMLSAHKGPRDVALFSIIDSDWPRVKSRLQGLLSALRA